MVLDEGLEFKGKIMELVTIYEEEIDNLKNSSNYSESFNIVIVYTLRRVISDLDKLSKDKQDKIIDVIKEFKTFIRTDEISLETLALLIFLNKD